MSGLNSKVNFVVTGCELSGEDVKISFRVENTTSDDLPVHLYNEGSGYSYDNFGNDCSSYLNFGNGYQSSSYSYIDRIVPQNRFVTGYYSISGLSASSTYITSFNTKCVIGTTNYTLIITNLPIGNE